MQSKGFIKLIAVLLGLACVYQLSFTFKTRGVEKKAAAALVDAALEVVTDAVKAHEPISIVGFGTLSIAHREERTGKNPKTGETLKIPARSVPVFKPGSTLKEAANSK